MKKLLGILVFGLIICNVSFAACLEGNCKNNTGTMTYPDGSKDEGIWKNGELVE